MTPRPRLFTKRSDYTSRAGDSDRLSDVIERVPRALYVRISAQLYDGRTLSLDLAYRAVDDLISLLEQEGQ